MRRASCWGAARRPPAGIRTEGGRPDSGPARGSGSPSRCGPGSGSGRSPAWTTGPAPASSAHGLRRESRSARRPPASTAGCRSARTAAPSRHTGCRRRPARTRRSRPRPTPGPDRPAQRPGPRLAGGVPRPASGCSRCRRTRPRSARVRPPARRPGPAAAPVTSPDPASPPSRPAHRTRTANPRYPACPPGGRCAPPRPPACRRPHSHQNRRLHAMPSLQQISAAALGRQSLWSRIPATTCTPEKTPVRAKAWAANPSTSKTGSPDVRS